MPEEHKGLDRSRDSDKKYPERWADTPLRDVFERFVDERTWMEPIEYLRSPRVFDRVDRMFFPRVDVDETADEVRVVADVPGVNPDHLSVDVRDNRLRLRGHIARESESREGERPYRYERRYGSFSREIMLPASVKDDQVRAVYKDGVLTITLPKQEEEKRTKVVIERT